MFNFSINSNSALFEALFWGISFLFIISRLTYLKLHEKKLPRLKDFWAWHDDLDSKITRRIEKRIISVIILTALVARMGLWLGSPLQTPWWFTQIGELEIGKIIEQGNFLNLWKESFSEFHYQQFISKSPILLPIAYAFQKVIGASFFLPAITGTFFGIFTIFFAWIFGRCFSSKVFGLVFAGFLAFSPLQIAWAKVAGVTFVGNAHIFILFITCYLAGKKKSIFWAILAGICAWFTLYEYYAVRFCVPVAILLLLIGLHQAQASRRRAFLIILVTALTIFNLYIPLAKEGWKGTLWPKFAGYPGNRGEKSALDFITKNTDILEIQAPRTFILYFSDFRRLPEKRNVSLGLGFNYGGVSLASTALLGFLGVIFCLVSGRRNYFWIFFSIFGFALVAFSASAPRRLLVFDLGWNGLATWGFILVLFFLKLKPKIFFRTSVVFFLISSLWSFSAIYTLHKELPADFTHTPFIDGFPKDAKTCKRCLEVANKWENDIENRALVILVDSNRKREQPTCPAGLTSYGHLAALNAKDPKMFIEFYPALQNSSNYLRPEKLYSSEKTFFYYLQRLVQVKNPKKIIWHFEDPTIWEKQLAKSFESNGGTLKTFKTPLAQTSARGGEKNLGFEITFQKSSYAKLFSFLDSLLISPTQKNSCVELNVEQITKAPGVPLQISSSIFQTTSNPEWAIDDGMIVKQQSETVLHTLSRWAESETIVDGKVINKGKLSKLIDSNFEWPEDYMLPYTQPVIGLNCAAYVGDQVVGQWLTVDPYSGELRSNNQIDWLPNKKWIGISRLGDELLLASADRTLFVFDVNSKKLISSFPADIWPTQKQYNEFAECATIGMWNEYYFSYNPHTTNISFYNKQGNQVASQILSKFSNTSPKELLSVGLNESTLAIGTGSENYVGNFITLNIGLNETCANQN